jgi:tRNA A37 methylthiotransferase MiaB
MLYQSVLPDFTYHFWHELLHDTLESCDAPYVGISYLFGATKQPFLQVAQWLREHYPEVPILAGGGQATYDFQELLRDNACDIVFRREAERQFHAFMQHCTGQESAAIPWGSAFRYQGGVYELGEPQGEVPIEWDIRPYYNLIRIEHYHEVGSLAAFSHYNGNNKRFATVLSNRGCRARCTFCTVHNFHGVGVRGRAVEDVIDEVKYLVRDKGIRQIDWLDDDLLWDAPRAVALFQGLAREVPELEWICNNGLIAAAITDELMYWMVQSGMKAFKIGVESGNDAVLRAIKKPMTKHQLQQRRVLFEQYPEVFVSANFILGFPYETFGQMLDTYAFANELQWDWSSFYIYQPLKGTAMFSVFQALGDDRCTLEHYGQTRISARAAGCGEFGYHFTESHADIRTGRDIFTLPHDTVPSQEQCKEIWFTFNLVTNVLQNPNFAPGGNPHKIVTWFDAIAQAYPYDASMAAALVRGYRLLGNEAKRATYAQQFARLLGASAYWQRRVREFPELLAFAEVTGV